MILRAVACTRAADVSTPFGLRCASRAYNDDAASISTAFVIRQGHFSPDKRRGRRLRHRDAAESYRHVAAGISDDAENAAGTPSISTLFLLPPQVPVTFS